MEGKETGPRSLRLSWREEDMVLGLDDDAAAAVVGRGVKWMKREKRSWIVVASGS